MNPEDLLADLLAEGTLPAAWAGRAAESPDHLTVHDPVAGWISARDLHTRAAVAAGVLYGAGVRRGDRVLVSAGAGVDLVALHMGALGSGLVVVPANTAYSPNELSHVASDADVRLAILDDPSRAPTGLEVLTPKDAGGGDPRQARPPEDVGAGDPALICYTSGTTGKPKGAVLTHANVLAGAEAVRRAWRWTADDRLVLALPLFHMHGLGVGLHGTLLAGASMVLIPRFDPDHVFDAVAEHDATLFFGVPTMYARIAASPRVGELARLRLCVSGSAPLSAELHQKLAQDPPDGAGQQVLERYGMTETLMNTSNPYDGERRAGSVGLPLPGVELRLGANDEIEVRGPNVFSGYWRNQEATDAVKDADGWFRTGDVGAIDDDGYVRIVGRTKELIISGGFNVYPREVEEALEAHPAVAEAAVVGTPDSEWGEVVTAYVVATTRDAAVLQDHCSQLLAPYKRPRVLYFVDALPRNALGKISRAALTPPAPAQ